ncbi:MAG: long-chain fatty acid--CoA ligase [Myxococcales bacterium]|nr:long-chain fatty acid--CoA ligase [Myxococcales bacterium]MCB9578105.1 long-chain fatty acid--CoA ligase [Polyangiaceae bacterium]
MSHHLAELLDARAQSDAVALRSKRDGRWCTTSWREWAEASRGLAAALIDCGVEHGDRVALMASTREEWLIADFGILAAGAVTVPVYPTSTAEQLGFILENSGARVVFVEDAAHLEALRAAAPTNVTLAVVISDVPSLEPAGPIAVRSYRDFLASGLAQPDERVRERQARIRPEDLATIVYTSGTSGPPRGARLTHQSLLHEVRALSEAVELGPGDEQLLFLPLAHIFARVVALTAVAVGLRTAIADAMHRMMESFAEVRPTFFASVPRLYEKVFAVANESVSAEGRVKERLWRWAVSIGLQASRARQRGEEPSGLLAARLRYAEKIALAKVRSGFGGRLRFAVSGGAPLSPELAEWFHAVGILVLEGYGLTEICGASHVNRAGRYRFGTVGLPVEGVEARVGADGEVLLRGPTLMRGYHGQPEATAEVLDADGWLHTGDIGSIDADGFLTIIDRKKDVIVTAGGSNVAPQNIERLLAASPWVSQAVVVGDRQRYLVALLTLNAAAAERWAREQKRSDALADLAHDPELRALIQLDVDDVNRRLSRFERIKRFAVLERELSVGAGELTETLKPRRDKIRERYAGVIGELYE